MSTPFPMLHVVVKDGKITGAHDEPCHLDGVASVPYAAIEPSPDPVQPQVLSDAQLYATIQRARGRVKYESRDVYEMRLAREVLAVQAGGAA